MHPHGGIGAVAVVPMLRECMTPSASRLCWPSAAGRWNRWQPIRPIYVAFQAGGATACTALRSELPFASSVPLLRCVALACSCSVRAARRQVALGRVAIDGCRAQDEMELVENARVVTVLKSKRGTLQELEAPPRKEVYIKLYKQRGVVCSHKRELPEAQIVSDLYPFGAEDSHCIGRLDSRSEGLLLVTSDGFFTRSASMPETHVEKEYVALVGAMGAPGSLKDFEAPTEATLRQLRDGVDLEDGKGLASALEAEVLQCDEALGLARLRLVVDSGRYHLVRRMMAALGHGLSSSCMFNLHVHCTFTLCSMPSGGSVANCLLLSCSANSGRLQLQTAYPHTAGFSREFL
ncbi:rluB [Symbiodinium natans]|uniref:RluB protein n=1 Tax=Symbiodinium natans TaxID=878477 RepID=A0A812SBP3_9DINO|nr:rluB [Symbiodinium natans]